MSLDRNFPTSDFEWKRAAALFGCRGHEEACSFYGSVEAESVEGHVRQVPRLAWGVVCQTDTDDQA